MTSSLYSKAKELLLGGDLDLVTDPLKVALINTAIYGIPVTGAAMTRPLLMSTSVHNLSDNMAVIISGVKGNTAANGLFLARDTTATQFTLYDIATEQPIVANGIYDGGGFMIPIGLHQLRSSLTGVASLSPVLTNKAVTGGIFSADDTTFVAVPSGPPCAALVLYRSSTDHLIAYMDDAPGLPIFPNGSDVTINWDTGLSKILRM